MYLLCEKSCQKGLIVAKYSAKVALVKRDLYSCLAPLCEPPLIAHAPSQMDEAFKV